MLTEPDSYPSEDSSTILIDRRYAELLEQTLTDLDVCLRQPLTIAVLRHITREVTDADPDTLIDCVGLHALHLRQLIADSQHDHRDAS